MDRIFDNLFTYTYIVIHYWENKIVYFAPELKTDIVAISKESKFKFAILDITNSILTFTNSLKASSLDIKIKLANIDW